MSAVLWLVTYLVHSTLLCGPLMFFRRRLRRIDGAETIWRAALLLPLLTATATGLSGVGAWGIAIGERATPLAPPSIGDVTTWSWLSADTGSVVVSAWLAVGALLLFRDCVAHMLFVCRLGVRESAEASLLLVVSDLFRHRGRRRHVRLTWSKYAGSPVALGRSEICLPHRAMSDLTRRELRALIAHEVAHIARHDPWWFAALACLESALFVQPLNRMVRRELHHFAETACDAWAARRLSDPDAMAGCLVEVAGWSRSIGPATVLGAVGIGGIAERVIRLLETPAPARSVSPALCVGVAVLALLALPVVRVRALPANDLPSEPIGVSAAYIEGYRAGQRHAQGRVDRGLHVASAQGRAGSPLANQRWRADLERQLQARRAPR